MTTTLVAMHSGMSYFQKDAYGENDSVNHLHSLAVMTLVANPGTFSAAAQ